MLSGQDQRLAGLSLEGHLTLSATINWHLSARKVDLRALLRVILGPAKVVDQAPLLEALSYLKQAYGVIVNGATTQMAAAISGLNFGIEVVQPVVAGAP